MKRIALTLILSMASPGLVTCNYDSNVSGMHWMLEMHDMHPVEAQEEDHTTRHNIYKGKALRSMDGIESWTGAGAGLRVPPEGAVPRGKQPYPYDAIDFQGAANGLKNPLPLTRSIAARGQKSYNTQCAVCHGYQGDGDGPVTPRFADIPAINNARIKAWKDGEIFHMITVGRGRMKPFVAQIEVEDRWAIVHYLRLLQNKKAGAN